jgi:hypothetical protein
MCKRYGGGRATIEAGINNRDDVIAGRCMVMMEVGN